MSYTTQCPACQTRFKVSDAHLALAEGMVRCGRCSHVFHAPSHFDAVAAAPVAPPVIDTPATTPAPGNNRSALPPQAEEDDFELELPDFTPEPPAFSAGSAPSAPPPRPEALDLPDFELMQPHTSARQPVPEQPLSWDEPDPQPLMPPPAAMPLPDNDATPEAQDIADFQRALAEALQPVPRARMTDTPLVDGPAYEAPLPAVGRQQRLAAEYAAAEDTADREAEPETVAPSAATLREPEIPPFSRREADGDSDEDLPPRTHTNWMAGTALGLLGVIGVVLLLGQLAFINRTSVSAELPELRPAFEALCRQLGCDVPLPTQRQLIRTEWSELSFIPQNDHLIQLNATLKNLAPYPQAFPVMELTLKDADDRVLIRKTLQPAQYLTPADLKLGRFNASSELKILTRMEVTQGKALGYSLHFYYP